MKQNTLCALRLPLLIIRPPQITTFPTLPSQAHLRSPSDEHGGAGSCAGIEQRLEPATQDRGVGQRLREGDGAQPREARTRFADSFGCRVRCSNRSGFLMLRVWVPFEMLGIHQILLFLVLLFEMMRILEILATTICGGRLMCRLDRFGPQKQQNMEQPFVSGNAC